MMRIPKHIGIIPDGNRRWAVQHGMEKQAGYASGLLPGVSLLKQAREYGIQELTYYGFTVDNCKRPSCQVEAFKRACVDAVELISKEAVELLVVGNDKSDCFPQELRAYTQRRSRNGGGIKVNFLVNYGWKWDLNGWKNNGKLHSEALSRVDLIIRWGGMCRLSGFLPIQSVYADFYVIDALWPAYRPEHFKQALQWYAKQDITLGG